MSDDEGEEWDEDIVIDLRKFAVEQATIIHLHKRDGAADANAVFTLARPHRQLRAGRARSLTL